MCGKRCFLCVLLLSWAAVLAAWVDPLYERHEEGIRLYRRGDYDGAAEKLRGVRGLTDESAVVHFNLGDAYYRLGDYESAMNEYFRAARGSDDELRAKVYYNLGNCQYFRGDLEKALHYFKKAIKLDPQDEDARVNYEFVLSRLDTDTSTAGNGGNGEGNAGAAEIPAATDSRERFIDERERQIIYDILDTEERLKRKKARFHDVDSGGEKGRNW